MAAQKQRDGQPDHVPDTVQGIVEVHKVLEQIGPCQGFQRIPEGYPQRDPRAAGQLNRSEKHAETDAATVDETTGQPSAMPGRRPECCVQFNQVIFIDL